MVNYIYLSTSTDIRLGGVIDNMTGLLTTLLVVSAISFVAMLLLTKLQKAVYNYEYYRENLIDSDTTENGVWWFYFTKKVKTNKLGYYYSNKGSREQLDSNYYLLTYEKYSFPVTYKENIKEHIYIPLKSIEKRPDFMLPQFYESINYSLKTLSELANHTISINYGKEIEKVGVLINKIKLFVDNSEGELNEVMREQNKEMIESYLDVHNKVMEQFNERIDTLNKDYNR